MTLISPGDCTLQCGMWFWNRDSEFTKWQHPTMWYLDLGWHAIEFAQTSPYWNSTSGFVYDHIIAVDMSFCTSLRNFIQIGPPSAEKNDVMSIFKMADLSHLGFLVYNNGFFEKPNYITSYRPSIDTIDINCLVFHKIAFLHLGVNIQDGGSSPCSILGVP